MAKIIDTKAQKDEIAARRVLEKKEREHRLKEQVLVLSNLSSQNYQGEAELRSKREEELREANAEYQRQKAQQESEQKKLELEERQRSTAERLQQIEREKAALVTKAEEKRKFGLQLEVLFASTLFLMAKGTN